MPIAASGADRRTSPGARRTALLARLCDAEGPLSVSELADAVGLHANTVRAHLAVLVHEGRVERSTEVRTRRGRPRELFRATDDADLAAPSDEGYAVLATMLAEHVGRTGGAAEGERIGRRWADGAVRADAPEPVAEVVRVLARAGFAPRVDGGTGVPTGAPTEVVAGAPPDVAAGVGPDAGAVTTILLCRCPFLDVARTHADVVCGTHLGLLRGALERLGVDGSVELVPFASPAGCVARLRVLT